MAAPFWLAAQSPEILAGKAASPAYLEVSQVPPQWEGLPKEFPRMFPSLI